MKQRTKNLIILFLIAVGASTGTAQAATDTTTQRLQLTILPAIESLTLAETPWTFENRTANKQILIGLRSNTAWTIQISTQSTYQKAASCQSNKPGGERNKDNSYQFLLLDCTQPISWADNSGEVAITYQIIGSL